MTADKLVLKQLILAQQPQGAAADQVMMSVRQAQTEAAEVYEHSMEAEGSCARRSIYGSGNNSISYSLVDTGLHIHGWGVVYMTRLSDWQYIYGGRYVHAERLKLRKMVLVASYEELDTVCGTG